MTETSSSALHHVRQLARHMAWADAAVWSAVLASTPAAGDARIADTWHHIHLVQHLFLQAWRGAGFAVRERGEFPSLDAIAAFGLDARRGVREFADGATEEELARELRMPWAIYYEQQAKQPAGVHTLGESMLQVFLHTQHHRGQVCARLREVGGVPPTVDFILWLWAGRPDEAVAV
jgi:uncharacterized damage-inducible protein DinB